MPCEFYVHPEQTAVYELQESFFSFSRPLMICRNDLANTLEAFSWFSQQFARKKKRENSCMKLL